MIPSFPGTLAKLRHDRGMSQRECAARLGITQALLSHYENGAREPGLTFLVRAADMFGVSTDYLLGRTDIERDAVRIRDAEARLDKLAAAAKELGKLAESLSAELEDENGNRG